MRIERFENDGVCELRIRGELRLDDARRVFERALLEDCSRIVLDLGGCEAEDRALSSLADLLGDAHLDVGFRGLREHQAKLLEYLGVTRPLGA